MAVKLAVFEAAMIFGVVCAVVLWSASHPTAEPAVAVNQYTETFVSI